MRFWTISTSSRALLASLAAAALACGGAESEPAAPSGAAAPRTMAADAPPPGPSDTGDVLNRHLEAFGAKNVEAILADYAADAVLLTPMGVVRGKAELEGVFKGLFQEFAKPGARFAMDKTLIDGNVAYITWSAETADNLYEFATDTFVVVDGKIAYQTFAGKITPKDPTASGPPPVGAQPDAGTTRGVLDRHLAAFGARNLEGIISDYRPEAVFLSNMGTITGTDGLSNLFEGLFAEFGKPGAKFKMHHLAVEGDVAFIVWSAETADNRYEWATDTFVIRDGKIAYQTLAAKVTPKS